MIAVPCTDEIGPVMNDNAAADTPTDGTRDIETRVRDLARDFTIELLPAEVEALGADLDDLLPPGTRVYLPHLAKADLADRVRAAARLAKAGLLPVPHVAARRLASAEELGDMAARFSGEAGVGRYLVLGGDRNEPAGPFDSALAILRTGTLQRNGVEEIGVAGHPEGHPRVADDVLERALCDKQAFASAAGLGFRIATQFTFHADPVIHWLHGPHARCTPGAPVEVGLPGLADIRTLMDFGRRCGVKTSLVMLVRNMLRVLRLAGTFDPGRIVVALAREAPADAGRDLHTLHLYPFGSVRQTARWARALADGDFRLSPGGDTIEIV